MSTRLCGLASAWALMTVAELTAGTKVTCRPCAVNRPWCRATKKPAESTAGTTATSRSGCSMPGVAAFPPLESRGTNRIARTTTAATAPSISAARTARVNLRGIAGSFLPRGRQASPGPDDLRACLRIVATAPGRRSQPAVSAGPSAGGTGAARLNGPIPAIHRFDWWPLGAGPGERGYSARLLPGSGQRDALPGAACVKNLAASCSERHRSADRYLNAGHSRPGQAQLSAPAPSGELRCPRRGAAPAWRASLRGTGSLRPHAAPRHG